VKDADDEIAAADAAEEAEAAALARALDGEPVPGLDAELETAALLRYARDGGALEEGAARAVRARVLGAADEGATGDGPPATRRPGRRERGRGLASRRRSPWRVLGPAVAAAAAAVRVVVLWRGPGGVPRAPAADLALLQAQAAAAQAGRGAALEGEMRRYRARLFATLGAHYGRPR